MSLIRKSIKVTCTEVEVLIVQSGLTVKFPNFHDFVLKRNVYVTKKAALLNSSEAKWSLRMYSFEDPETFAEYVRFKVRIEAFPRILLRTFKVVWSVQVNDAVALERTMTKLDDNFNVNVPFFKPHVSSTGSVNLQIKMAVKSVGQHSLCVLKLLNSSTSSYNTQKQLLDDPSFSDFKFIVGQKDFPVHKAILAAQSPVMKAMFTSEMDESKNGVCEVNAIDPEIFENMLAFVYCGDLPENFSAKAAKIYEAAHFYQIDTLKKACATELREKLTETNALDTYKWLQLYQDDLHDLKGAAWNLIKCNILKIDDPLTPMDPKKIDEVLRIRQLEADFWKENLKN